MLKFLYLYRVCETLSPCFEHVSVWHDSAFLFGSVSDWHQFLKKCNEMAVDIIQGQLIQANQAEGGNLEGR